MRTRGMTSGMRVGRAAGGFTLIELLIVIGIIALLVALAVVVGAKVTEAGRARATANITRVLDESRGAWERNADSPLPEVLEVEVNASRSQFFPLIDGRLATADAEGDAWPSLRYYTALVLQDQSVSAIFEQLDSKFVEPGRAPTEDFDGDSQTWALPALEIRDAWDRPLRFVHPAFHGGHGDFWDADAGRINTQRETLRYLIPTGRGNGTIEMEFRRSYRPFNDEDANRRPSWVGDADEGMCVGATPYFYSAGSDGDPGTREDNVYAVRPKFPVETKGFD